MPYCVNCGVELDEGAQRCPLCGTPVYRPDAPGAERQEPFFAAQKEEIAPVSHREMALLLSAMLISAAVCCCVLNLFLGAGRAWSLYVVGAAAMLWIWFVLPLAVRRIPPWVALPIDVGAVGLYLFLIAIDLHGMHWFRGLVLPVLLSAVVILLVLCFLLRDHRHKLLTTATFIVCAAALLALAAEYFCDRYFGGAWHPGWSLIVLAVCVSLAVPLLIVRHVPALREEARRRFHM